MAQAERFYTIRDDRVQADYTLSIDGDVGRLELSIELLNPADDALWLQWVLGTADGHIVASTANDARDDPRYNQASNTLAVAVEGPVSRPEGTTLAGIQGWLNLLYWNTLTEVSYEQATNVGNLSLWVDEGP